MEKKIRSVYFNRPDLDRLEEVAEQRRTTVSAVIREAVVQYLKKWKEVKSK